MEFQGSGGYSWTKPKLFLLFSVVYLMQSNTIVLCIHRLPVGIMINTFFSCTFGSNIEVLIYVFLWKMELILWCFSWNLAGLNQWYVYAAKADKPAIKKILQFLDQVLDPHLWIDATYQIRHTKSQMMS